MYTEKRGPIGTWHFITAIDIPHQLFQESMHARLGTIPVVDTQRVNIAAVHLLNGPCTLI